jgi:hypothetical protein
MVEPKLARANVALEPPVDLVTALRSKIAELRDTNGYRGVLCGTCGRICAGMKRGACP